jgi:hypothetical protein
MLLLVFRDARVAFEVELTTDPAPRTGIELAVVHGNEAVGHVRLPFERSPFEHPDCLTLVRLCQSVTLLLTARLG